MTMTDDTTTPETETETDTTPDESADPDDTWQADADRRGVYYDPDAATSDEFAATTRRDRTTERAGVEALAERTTLTLGGLLAYGVGFLSVLVGLANLFDPIAFVTFTVAGLWAIPATRRVIEAELGVHTSRWLATAIYVVILTLGGAIATA